MEIKQASFVVSNTQVAKCPTHKLPEYAFIGRSNVGKSSLINMLTNHKGLAKTSSKPGKTQLINHFLINKDWYLVDLPGYGYAAVPESMKKEWQKELEKYLVSRKSLAGLILLTDIRHPLKFFDEQMLHWAKDGDLPVHVLLTKADKLKYGASKNTLQQVKNELKKLKLPFNVQLFSTQNKQGLDELSLTLAKWLELGVEPNTVQQQ